MTWDDVLGLGEILNVHDLVTGSKDLDDKIRLAGDAWKFIRRQCGRNPWKSLKCTLRAGPSTTTKPSRKEEAIQRLRLGMWVMLREGSSERNLGYLIELVASGKLDSRRFCFGEI